MNPNRSSKESGALFPVSLFSDAPSFPFFLFIPCPPLGVQPRVPRLLETLGTAHLLLSHAQQCVLTLGRSAEAGNRPQMHAKGSNAKKKDKGE